MSRVGFSRSGFILAVLKDAGTRPEVREEFIREVGNARVLLKTGWRIEEGIGSRGQLVACLDVTILWTSSEERGIKWVKTVGDRAREDCGRVKKKLISLTFWVKYLTNSSAVREEGRAGEKRKTVSWGWERRS